MGGTKIFVVQMRQIIKMGIMAAIGLILLVFLLSFFLPGRDRQTQPMPQSQGAQEIHWELRQGAGPGSAQPIAHDGTFIPGTYSAEIILHNNPVLVEVTVSSHSIESIELRDMGEVQAAFFPLFEPTLEILAEVIIEHQSINIPAATDNTVTEGILLRAVEAALRQAAP